MKAALAPTPKASVGVHFQDLNSSIRHHHICLSSSPDDISYYQCGKNYTSSLARISTCAGLSAAMRPARC